MRPFQGCAVTACRRPTPPRLGPDEIAEGLRGRPHLRRERLVEAPVLSRDEPCPGQLVGDVNRREGRPDVHLETSVGSSTFRAFATRTTQ